MSGDAPNMRPPPPVPPAQVPGLRNTLSAGPQALPTLLSHQSGHPVPSQPGQNFALPPFSQVQQPVSCDFSSCQCLPLLTMSSMCKISLNCFASGCLTGSSSREYTEATGQPTAGC